MSTQPATRSTIQRLGSSHDRSAPASCQFRRRATDTTQAQDTVRKHAMLSVWRKVAVFAIGQTAILVGVELWLQATPGRGSAPSGGPYRNPAPFVEFYQTPNYDDDGIQTNNVGFRYGDLSVDKPANEFRVFFMSTSLGFNGNTNESTIAGIMENRLRESAPKGKKIRIVNASGVSFCSTQSLSLLVTKVLDYKPDMLIVFHGSEALFMPTEYESRPGYPFNFALREDRHKDAISSMNALQNVVQWLTTTRTMRRFHPEWLQTRLQSRMAATDNRISITELQQYAPYVDVLAADIRKIVQIAAGYGTKVLVAIPPCRHADILPGAMEMMEDRLLAGLDGVSPSVVRYVDTLALDRAIAEAHAWKVDGVHWADPGNKIIADRLLQSLAESNWLSGFAGDLAGGDSASPRRQAKGKARGEEVTR